MPVTLPIGRCAHALVLLLAIITAGFWAMDDLTDRERDVASDAPLPLHDPLVSWHDGRRRMFILVVDSLRYETAIDPAIMPNLVALREKGVSAKVRTVHDAVSVPALRAAFTGRDRVTVFGFVRNFWHGEGAFTSLFTQLSREGFRTLVHSDGSFKQFNADLAERGPNGVGIRGQNRTLQRVQEAYAEGEFDLAIMHISYSDAVAHSAGIHSPAYLRAFSIVDGLIADLDATIPDDECFVIFGDHGHDELGRHQMGMDVPTYGWYRGPPFRRGVGLGEISINDTRYLLSYALEVPLPADYPSGRHPSALVLPPEPSEEWTTAFDVLADEEKTGTGVLAERRAAFYLTVLCLALLATLWTALVRGGALVERRRAPLALGTWATVVLTLFSGGQPLAGVAGAAIGAGLVAWCAVAGGGRREFAWLATPLLAAIAMEHWGLLLSFIREWFHWPKYATMVGAWAGLIVLGLAAARRWGPMPATWGLTVITGLLMYPSIYRYGAPAAMAPVWLAGLLYVVAASIGRGGAAPGSVRRGNVLRLALLVLLLAPFGMAYAENFRFVSWLGPLAWRLWGDRLTEEVLLGGVLLGILGKLIVFVRWRAGWAARIAGLAAVALVQFVHWKGTNLPPEHSSGPLYVGGIAALGAISAVLVLLRWEFTDRRTLARIAALAALYLAYYYTIRVPGKAYWQADCLFAAFVLSGRFLGRWPALRDRPATYAWLLLLGVLATGWMTLAWTFHRLEWAYLFDWFDVRLVERNAGAFSALIGFRYCIPLVMIRILLAEAVDGRWPYPQRLVTLLLGLKAMSVLMVACGMAFHRVGSDVYLEAVQQTGIWVFIGAALPWGQGSRERGIEASREERDDTPSDP